jgi:hypothetical protein
MMACDGERVILKEAASGTQSDVDCALFGVAFE